MYEGRRRGIHSAKEDHGCGQNGHRRNDREHLLPIEAGCVIAKIRVARAHIGLINEACGRR